MNACQECSAYSGEFEVGNSIRGGDNNSGFKLTYNVVKDYHCKSCLADGPVQLRST